MWEEGRANFIAHHRHSQGDLCAGKKGGGTTPVSGRKPDLILHFGESPRQKRNRGSGVLEDGMMPYSYTPTFFRCLIVYQSLKC
jgi:hypothetical protein